MNELGFSPIDDPELSKRTGYLEGREDLFQTKLLKLEGTGEIRESILVVSRDPGSANSLIPVLRILSGEPGVGISVVADGRAEDAISNSFEIAEAKPVSSGTDILHPDVVVMAAAEEKGLETWANATYENIPQVVIEDYPGAVHQYLRACLDPERPGLRVPDKICVMDEAAKQLMVASFPNLESKIEVTGQPAFDRIASEDIDGISNIARGKLGISPEEKVVAFMSTDEVTKEQVGLICEQLMNSSSDFVFIFRRHPRDNTSYEEYFQMFNQMGIKNIDSRELKTDEVSAAADIVMTSWSTAGLEAIYRGKPTIHIVDRNSLDVPAGLSLPLPAVQLGASIGIDNIKELPTKVDSLLDPDSTILHEIKANMRKNYPNDGKNSQRVAAVIDGAVNAS